MSKLHIRPEDCEPGQLMIDVTPESANWCYVGFKYSKFKGSQKLEINESDREVCVVLLSGKIDASSKFFKADNLGSRKNVFDKEQPYSLYISPTDTAVITFLEESEVAICSAPATGVYNSRIIKPSDCSIETRGEGSNTRFITNILPEDKEAESLLVVEVITPSGNWSSYPPHKHDVDDVPHESYLEETYFHKIQPEQGFGFQRVYTDDRSLDESICIENNSLVMVPKGYHPVGTPHGYDLYYLNVMAGPERIWKFKNDPAHEWIIKKG